MSQLSGLSGGALGLGGLGATGAWSPGGSEAFPDPFLDMAKHRGL